MIALRPLLALDGDLLSSLIVGYSSASRYEVSKVETPEYTRIELHLVQLAQPFIKRYAHLDASTLGHYSSLITQGNAFGAYADERCVAIALAEPQAWNLSLFVHELHIAAEFQRRGVGRLLIEALVLHGCALGMRCITCETQATNVPAIKFYRAMGFTLEGVDLSLYTNHDRESGEVAVFMKRSLDE